MKQKNIVSLFVTVDEIQQQCGVSRAKAYQIIRELNQELKKQNPRAIIISGKVNRTWYEEACLISGR